MKLGAMTNQTQDTNYYEILEVQDQALPHEIHKAYTRARATYSTENPALYSMFSPEEARELLRLIEEAYTVLGNPSLRKSYDESRLRGERSPHVALVAPNHPPPPHVPPPPAAPLPPSIPAVDGFVDPRQLANEHRALPDFGVPSPMGDPPRQQTASGKTQVPEGVGHTQLSTYKIDDSFEQELKAVTNFDGSFLQRTRLYKNVSIDRLSEATRISRTYLMAVETNDYKSLPAAVFTRGFIVQIARILCLNENQVASSYIKMFKAGGGK
jgi:curved DNA-binding protein CbpA